MQFVKQSHISTGLNWSPQGFVVARNLTIACVEAGWVGVGVCWGNWQLLLCVGECKDYFGVNFPCVGITNTWPLPRIAKTHTANECVLSIDALLFVCFCRSSDWKWCHWDDLCDLTFRNSQEIIVQSKRAEQHLPRTQLAGSHDGQVMESSIIFRHQ